MPIPSRKSVDSESFTSPDGDGRGERVAICLVEARGMQQGSDLGWIAEREHARTAGLSAEVGQDNVPGHGAPDQQ